MADTGVDPFNSAPPVEIAKALVEIQATLQPLVKSATNDEYGSSFVPLEEVTEKAHQLLRDHKIAVLQPPSEDEHGHLTMDTILVHESGASFMRRTRLALQKPDPQGHASALTYMRRYALMGTLGLTGRGEDDDGNKASGVFAPVTEEQLDRIKTQLKHLKWPKNTIAAELFKIKTRDHAYLAIKNYEEIIAQRVRDEESKNNAAEVEFGKKIKVTGDDEDASPRDDSEVSPTSLAGFERRIKALGLRDEVMERKVISMGSGGGKTGTPFLSKVMDKADRIESLNNFLIALESGVHALPGEFYATTDEPRVVEENVA